MVDIKLIESFVLVIRAGSMTRAEALSGTPKATLSRQLVKLEKDLDLELVRRDSRRMIPTEAGRRFFIHGEQLLAEMSARIEAARTEAQDLADGVMGDISVLTDTHFSTPFMCRVTRLFLERYPNVRCRFDVTGRISSPKMDDVDCYVGMSPPPHPNLVEKVLGQLNFSLFASTRYLEMYGEPKSQLDLPRHRAITLDDATPDVVHRLFSGSNVFDYEPRSVIRGNDYWVVKTFCIDGLGIALLPDFFTGPELEAGALVRVLPDWRPEPVRVYCAYQRQRYSGRKLRAFIELTAASFQRIDGFHYYVGSRMTAARPDEVVAANS
ncbi:LysR family transcriptional regulator [Pandoraea terrae]|uniref:LysR family transcriptional regulator n=1 Tax=Pandoraea terrae TaxID=1537710 RepID=A0A5E4RW01_9BURK|nr:LysR family transcriptional regulator [Pandoraea terrae]VVD66028.1 LysR family transcriptional regulator [Pandoraea terrae]